MRPESRRHLTRSGKRTLDPGKLLLADQAMHAPVDLEAVFGNGRPVEAEIGIGKGTFLLARAKARPELNLLGIEYARSYALYSADRARRAGLENIRIAHCDAAHFFQVCLEDRTLWRVHIYFPDPWPKRRHHRRRLIQPGFLVDLRRILQPGGQLILATDHLEYFEKIRGLIEAESGFTRISLPRITGTNGRLVRTNFERKYAAEGRPLFALAMLRYRMPDELLI